MRRICITKHAVFFDCRYFGIRKKHILDVFCLSEIPKVRAGFGVDCDYLCTRVFEIVVSLAQTEELPGADPSVKCAKENQHDLLFANQTAEPGHLAVAIR